MPEILTSRQRLLAALACQPVDHPPCAFMMYKGLKSLCKTDLEFLQAQMALGLDGIVELPVREPVVVNDHYNLHGLPVNHHPAVSIREWREKDADGAALLNKEYATPAGTLRTVVKPSSVWTCGEHIPFLDDQLIPASTKFLVERERDLDALPYLLVPPDAETLNDYSHGSRSHLEFARRENLLVNCGWGVGADMLGWLCGLKNIILMSYQKPDLLEALLSLIADWNRARMRALFSQPVDLFIKRAWYENCDFWTPASWKKFILPILEADVRLAHQAGVRFGYILTSNAMPLVGMIIDAGVDVLIGVDPREYDLEKLAGLARGRLCLWGGVNGHLTVETGSPQAVREEVGRALATLGAQSGFILSPVDNIRQDSPAIRENIRALIDAWQNAG